jgi:hypothetical protein
VCLFVCEIGLDSYGVMGMAEELRVTYQPSSRLQPPSSGSRTHGRLPPVSCSTMYCRSELTRGSMAGARDSTVLVLEGAYACIVL